jgi:metallophosphoesterase (TIGR00282 family)
LEITVLCIGDVVGKPGRAIVSQGVPRLVKERGVDCVIANVENAAAGSGLTEALYQKFVRYGVHLMTLGDHIYRKAEIMPVLERSERIVRPANYPDESIGKEFAVFQTPSGVKVAVISLMGRLFMKPPANCPFHAIDRVLERMSHLADVIVVDMHAEATSEKVAMGWHLAGRVSVLFGTHTHIPTADERILEGGTAYITDLGMSGPYDSVLGRRKDRVLKAMMTGLPTPFDVAVGDSRMCGVLVKVDAQTGRAKHIERVCVQSSGIPGADDCDDD